MGEGSANKTAALAGAMLLLAGAGAVPAAAQVEQEMRAEREQAEAQPEATRTRPPALDRQFRRALTAWRTGSSLLEAKARLDRVLRALPHDAQARKLRAEVLLEMGRPEEALRDAEHAAGLRSGDGEAHLLHAEAARESSRFDAARRALDRAAEHLPEDAALHTRFSWNAILLDRPMQAEAFARVALALDPASAPAYRQLARVFMERGRPDEAVAVLARGLRASVLRAHTLREDDLLRQLADHPRLERFMQ